jgi:hypothetical protein
MDSKGLKERITGGLIVWLLVTIFIQPILSFAWKAIVVVGGVVHQGYVDRIYSHAALGDRDDYGFLILMALFLTLPFFGLFFSFRELPTEEASIPAKKWLDAFHIAYAIMKIIVAITIFLIIVVFSIMSGTKIITASFTQRLTVLAPAISDTEYKTFKARWASMQGKSDYDSLVAEMDKRAVELGVKLPPVRKP